MNGEVVRFSYGNAAAHFARSRIDENNRIGVVHADENLFAIAGNCQAVRIFADLDIRDNLIGRRIDHRHGRRPVAGHIHPAVIRRDRHPMGARWDRDGRCDSFRLQIDHADRIIFEVADISLWPRGDRETRYGQQHRRRRKGQNPPGHQ